MFKKFISIACIAVFLGSSALLYAETTLKTGEVTLTPQELNKEISAKEANMPLAKLIESVEAQAGGTVISLRLGRLAIPQLAYRMVILKKQPVSLEFLVVNAKTGEILLTQKISEYPIVPPTAQQIQK